MLKGGEGGGESLSVGDDLVLDFAVFLKGYGLVEVEGHQTIELVIESSDLDAVILCVLSGILAIESFLGLKLSDKPVSDLDGQGHVAETLGDLVDDALLADVRLGAGNSPLGTAQVIVAFLGLSSYLSSAFATPQEAAVKKRLESVSLRLAFLVQHNLHCVKQFVCDDGFVIARIAFAFIEDDAAVDGISEQAMVLVAG